VRNRPIDQEGEEEAGKRKDGGAERGRRRKGSTLFPLSLSLALSLE